MKTSQPSYPERADNSLSISQCIKYPLFGSEGWFLVGLVVVHVICPIVSCKISTYHQSQLVKKNGTF